MDANRSTGPALLQFENSRRVAGLTHGFYRYPAATSPEVVRELIEKLSEPGQIVLDPFMGGGTAVVEALASGRTAVGLDINELAVVVARVKTTPLTTNEWNALDDWAADVRLFALKPQRVDARAAALPEPLRDAFGSALRRAGSLATSAQRNAARCALLRTGQWALESRDELPNWQSLQRKLREVLEMMRAGMLDLVARLRSHGMMKHQIVPRRILLHGNNRDPRIVERLRGIRRRVHLIVTSPPYPGVHVLYHRWQINSRRETAAPYWIADRRDGHGPNYYTLGGRSRSGQMAYFEQLGETYMTLRPLLHRDAIVAQIVAFTDARSQLPLFLAAMHSAGYVESDTLGAGVVGLTRAVPNRRWYARGRDFGAAQEVLLLHSAIKA